MPACGSAFFYAKLTQTSARGIELFRKSIVGMRMKSSRRFLLLLLAAMVIAPAAGVASSKHEKKREKIREMREEVLSELYDRSPRYKDVIAKAAGHAVFSNVGINVIFASFAGGQGVVVDEDGNETFMNMGSAGVGIGLGVKDFRGIFIFYNDKKLEDFIEHGWDFSGQADAAAKSDDKGGQIAMAGNVFEGVEVIQITETGLALQATLQGTKYWPAKDLNYESD